MYLIAHVVLAMALSVVTVHVCLVEQTWWGFGLWILLAATFFAGATVYSRRHRTPPPIINPPPRDSSWWV